MTDSKTAFVIESPSTKSFPFSGTWRNHALFRPNTFRKLTLTNTSPNDAVIRRNGGSQKLAAKSLEVLALTAGEEIRVEPAQDKDVAGYWAMHDVRFDWSITDPTKRLEQPHSGPVELAVVSDPQSDFAVNWIANEGVLERIGPGEARSHSLTSAEARTMGLQAEAGTTSGQARGIICGTD